MTATTNYYANKVIDWFIRGQAFTPPATVYVALFKASRGSSSSLRSTAVSSGDTIIPATPNGHMYKCTTAGTTGSSEPTWPTSNNQTVTDGTAVWTEMYSDFKGNTGSLTEVSGGAYARQSVTSSLANWAGTQGAGTTVASTGSSGTTSNNNAIAYATSTAIWGLVAFGGIYDAVTAGNLLIWGPFTTPQQINSGATTPTFAAGAVIWQIDN